MRVRLLDASSWQPGQKARIISGPFEAMTGYVIQVDHERGQIRLVINLLGRETPIEVEASQIIPEDNSF